MKAGVLVADRKFEIRTLADPRPGPGQVLIRVAWTSICGTDLHIYLGEFKERVKYPAILCHEFSGTVEALGDGVKGLAPGDPVVADPIVWCGRCPACLVGHNNVCASLKLVGIEYDGAFAELVVVDAEKVFKVPGGVGLREASLAELYALGVHATRKALIEPGDRVVILGAGRLGLAVLELVKQSAAAFVASVDIIDSRLAIAKSLGADLAINAAREDPVEKILAMTGGLGVDRVIECVGTAAEIPGGNRPPAQAVAMARSGGRVVLMGLGGQESPVPWKQVALKELAIQGSRVTLGDFPRALELMAQGRFHPEKIITRDFPLDEIGRAFELLEDNPQENLKFLVKIE